MPSVRLSRISFQYADPIEIFTQLDLHLEPGWTGVVGENGSGKTTLLQILSGALSPDAGRVEREPVHGTTHLCRQRVAHITGDVIAFAEAWDRDAMRLRGRLGCGDDHPARWATLSPGERKRWQVGAALWRRPDVLLLDEPTNHIDSSARGLVLSALHRYRGVGVLVSHDRGLLDELCQRIVRIDSGRAVVYRGNYTAAREQWLDEQRRARQNHAAARSAQRKLERRLASARNQHAKAAGDLSTARRAKGPRDSDARSAGAKGRVQKAEARLSRQVRVMSARRDHAARETAQHQVRRQRGRSLYVDYDPAPMSRLVSLDHVGIRAGGRIVLHDVSVALGRTSRVYLAGPNGSGKTSLLRHLVAAAGERTQRILYVPQVVGEDTHAHIVEEIRAAEPRCRDRVLGIAAALGLSPGRALDSPSPSPGELRKLMIAMGLGSSVWAVMLDEPTNHLDLPSIERLEQALEAYPGALLLVTHDERLAAAVTNETWRIDDGRVVAHA